MQTPPSVIELVKKFERHLHAYKSGTYNETQVRVEFINPFFEALGWDVYNKNGYSDQYKDVIHEFSLKTQEYSNAPDYLFKVGTMKKFFVEAKKPVIYIKEDIHPAYQLRRYAWSAKLPLSILTDFEEFAVYDCRLKPNQKDKASVARRLYYTFREYPDMWGEIHSKFSREAVLQGEYDKFAEGGTRVKGTEVDDAFLREIEGWRDSLARNIALRNSRLSGGELNYSVQKIIDRIIFLRICEGRGIEEFKELHNLSGKTDIYKHLLNLFRNADKKYNSGLFHFTKEKDISEDIDNITPALSIDDKIFKDIIESLYYPKSPYEFSVFGAEILGHVYEQFLGKVIRLTAGHQAKVEEKPEVKKAGGVYYTPAYIVDYIVKNTLGKKLEEIEERGKGKGRGKEIIEEAGKLRVLDPACGSGSFLLGVYQYLLDWHVKIYQSHEKEFKERVYRSGKEMDTGLHLTTKEKKRILLNNIYGVDIDSQAVEVSKLSLLLKVLEGETDETLAKQLDIFTERALPDLSKNIKCGNSLIDTDFYDGGTLFEEETNVNPFNWQKGFPEVFRNGGFDVVIGNPPWVQYVNLDLCSQKYLKQHYVASNDLYSIFLERGIQILRENEYLGFIIPSLFIKGMRYSNLRELLNKKSKELVIKEYGDNVFKKVQMPSCIVLLNKGNSSNQIDYFANNKKLIFSKVDIIRLSDIAEIRRGLEIGKDQLIDKGKISCVTGGNLNNYLLVEKYFITEKTFLLFKKDLTIFKSPKLLLRETGKKFYIAIDYNNTITTRSIYNIRLNDKRYAPESILGILNSKLFEFYFNQFISPDTAIFPKIRIAQANELPLPLINDGNKGLYNDISKLAKNITEQKVQLVKNALESERTQVQTKIDYCEDRINKIVYELYGLTEEEIKIVEGKENN